MKHFYCCLSFLLALASWQALLANDSIKCQISVTGGQTDICQGQPLVLISQLEGVEDLFTHRHWHTEGNLLSATDGQFVRFDTSIPGTFLVSFTAWNDDGDNARCEIKIEVVSKPNIEIVENFGLFRRFLFKKPMPRLKIIPAENYIFQWFYNDHEIPGADKARFRPPKPGNYHVKVTTQQGCSAFSKIIIVE